MEKDFSNWHRKKSWIQKDKVRPFFHEQEVWFALVGSNVGFEQDGRGKDFLRPVIIVKKFNDSIGWCLPLTKKKKSGEYYFVVTHGGGVISTAILSQLRLIDAKRLLYQSGNVMDADFEQIKKRLTRFLE